MMTLSQKVRARWEKLNADRFVFSSLYQELAEYFCPAKANITTVRYPGQQNNLKAYDSTGILCARRLASALQSTLTSDVIPWFDLVMVNEELNKRDTVKRWLSETSERMFLAIQLSNFGLQMNEGYHSLVTFGSSLMLEEEGKKKVSGFGGLNFQSFHPTEYVWDVDENGLVNEVYRRIRLTVTEAIDMFGMENITTKMREAYDRENWTKPFEVIHGVFPRSEFVVYGPSTKMPFASVYTCLDDTEVIRESGYRRFPFIAPRWTRSFDEAYGRSPSMDALPDTRTLNRVVELELRAMVKAVNPPIVTSDDGALGGTIVIKPGGVLYVRQGAELKYLESAARFDVINLKKNELQDAIRKAFYIDQLLLPPVQNTPPTATEVNRRLEQMYSVMGPEMSRLTVELMRPIVKNTFEIMMEANALPAPPPEVVREFQKRNAPVVTVSFKGALARAQKMGDVIATQRWLSEVIAPAAQINPSTLDLVNTDSVGRLNGELLGVPYGMIRSPLDVDRIRKMRQEQQSQMVEQEQERRDMEAAGRAAPAMKVMQEAEGGQGAI